MTFLWFQLTVITKEQKDEEYRQLSMCYITDWKSSDIVKF